MPRPSLAVLHTVSTGTEHHPTLLFLHGFMGSAADWREVAAHFARTHRCVAVDLPGHGRSTGLAGEDAYTMQGVTRALVRVLDDHAIEQCVVVGYSMGGRVALHLALEAPDRCRKVVLESATPGLRAASERRARRGVDEARAVRLETGDLREFLEEWYHQPLFASLSRHPGLPEQMIRARSDNDSNELARSLRGMGTGRQASLWERLPGLRVSTMAVAGALDGKYVEIVERMAVMSPRIRADVVPNVGHNVHAEHPAAFFDLLRDFLTQP